MDVGVCHPLAVNELPYDISIEGTHVLAEMLAHENDLLMEKENLLENTDTITLLKKARKLYFNVLVSL